MIAFDGAKALHDAYNDDALYDAYEDNTLHEVYDYYHDSMQTYDEHARP